jgi:hypothetical protein
MAAKSSSYSNSLLKLVFQAVNFANVADNTVTSPLTNLYVSLHTASPGVGGNQATNETTYVGYARRPVARTSGGFTVTANSVSPANVIDFGECTASPGAPVTHFAIGTVVSGAGVLLYIGAISPAITITVGVLPRLKVSSSVTET